MLNLPSFKITRVSFIGLMKAFIISSVSALPANAQNFLNGDYSTGLVEMELIAKSNSNKPAIYSDISNISNGNISSSDFRLALNQNREVICGSGSTTYVKAETKRYHVNICGDSNSPKLYVGSSKTGQAIVLPLKSYSSGQYVATSGNIKYTLNSRYLTVTQNGRIIRREAVLSWR